MRARGDSPFKIPVDLDAKRNWEAAYREHFRDAFLASHEVSDAQRARLLFLETMRIYHEMPYHLRQQSDASGDRAYARGQLAEYIAGVLAYAGLTVGRDDDVALDKLLLPLGYFFRSAGSDLTVREQMISRLLTTSNPELRNRSAGLWQQLQLRRHPLDLQRTTLDGGSFDLAQLKGKIVLLDFWSTGCSSCISAMPHLKDVLSRYRSQGFEIVSLCLDEEKNRDQIEKIMARFGANWPVILEPWSTTPLRERFNFTFVPVYMLLDRDGLLVSLDAGGEKLEPAVRRLLGLQGTPAIAAPDFESGASSAGAVPLD